MFRVMTHAGIILALLAALFLGVVASILTANADAPRLLASHEQSTGPYNPNLPSEDAIARGA
jgi:hypothetical protein